MPTLKPNYKGAEYTGIKKNTYSYIYSIGSQIPQWTPMELGVLKSNNLQENTISNLCNRAVFGSSQTTLTTIYKYNQGNYHDPLLQNPKVYQDIEVYEGYPLRVMYSGGATIFTDGMEFGMAEGETEPAKISVTSNSTTRQVTVDWYKNGEIVATDTLPLGARSGFAIAVVANGTSITEYSYVWVSAGTGTASENSGMMSTSGSLSSSFVLQILNEGGYAGSEEPVYGWTDEEKGDFIYSKIYDHNGNPAYTGYAAGGRPGDTIASANEDLINKCNEYGGYLGTDIVEYMTGMDSQEGWAYLNSEGDGTEMSIPHYDGTELKIVWKRSFQLPGSSLVLNNVFVIYKDGEYQGYIPNQYTTNGAHIYLTWYNQNGAITNAERLVCCKLIRTSGAIAVPQYDFYTLESGRPALLVDEFSSNALLDDLISGYDPFGKGEEDDKQKDPDEMEEPNNDPLATGFLYAFMVDSMDMVHLNECLLVDTFSEKLRTDFGNNLYKFIVSYHMMPCLTNGSSLVKRTIAYRGTQFIYGNNNPLQLAPITKTWYNVSCGTKLCLPSGVRPDGFENWSNAHIQLYLPFIGYVHLNTADVWNENVTIGYVFDILQGTCVANVGVGNKGTIYSFSGSCKYSIPFTNTIDRSNQELLAGIVSGAGAVASIAGVSSGNVNPMSIMSSVGGVAEATGHFIAAAEHKATINRGGSLTGTPGWNMPRNPALIITLPDCIKPGNTYNNINGFPTYKEGTLSEYTNNYVEVSQIDLKGFINGDGALPNENELEMINSTLKGGVYV